MKKSKIQRDAPVAASDGELGRVTHVIVDGQTREVTELVVGGDGAEWLVPIGAVQGTRGDTILLQGTRAQVQAGRFDRMAFQPVDDENAEDESAKRSLHGGAPLHKAADDAVVIGEPSHAPESPGEGRTRHGEGHMLARTADAGTIRLREEELRANKQTVEAGAVEVRTEVISEQQTIEVPVTREEVVIDRHPVDRRSSDRPIGEGEEIRVPVREEQVTVGKDTVVTEEIEVGKRRVQDTERISDTVRREEVSVEHDEDVDVRHRQANVPHADECRRPQPNR